ncbi:hypothetical protein OAU50_04265 [Planctomycetota bacterium]|nr:hypothetical protein [Planctomycetota bacterium]
MFRVLNSEGSANWKRLQATGAWRDLADLAVKTDELSADSDEYAEIIQAYPEAKTILEHDAIPMISYPSEWTPTMLIDAGLHTLKVQLALHKHGLALKDASAYNIQFVGCKPVFIDITSSEEPERSDIWHALGQFQRHFLYPTLLYMRRKLDFRGLFLTQMDGIQPWQAAHILGSFGWLRPSQLFSVYLPHWLSVKESSPTQNTGSKPATKSRNPAVLEFTLGRLVKRLNSIRRKIGRSSHWVEYEGTCTYSDSERATKHEYIKKFAADKRPKRVTDFGSNTGEYSKLMADAGAYVVAVEGDIDAADTLYRNCADSPYTKSIQVICMDLANPTPAYGHNGTERQGFFERHYADTALALALVHHLQSSSRLNYRSIAALFRRLTESHLVAEWIGPKDEMFAGMISQTSLETTGIDIDTFKQAFTREFPKLCEIKQTKEHRIICEFVSDAPTNSRG